MWGNKGRDGWKTGTKRAHRNARRRRLRRSARGRMVDNDGMGKAVVARYCPVELCSDRGRAGGVVSRTACVVLGGTSPSALANKRVSYVRVCAAAVCGRLHPCKIHILGGARQSPHIVPPRRGPLRGRLTTVDATGWCGGGRAAGERGIRPVWPVAADPPHPSAPHAPPEAPRPLTQVGVYVDWQHRRWTVAARVVRVVTWGGASASPPGASGQGRRLCPPPRPRLDRKLAGELWRSGTRRLRHKPLAAAAGTVGWPKLVVAARPQSGLGSLPAASPPTPVPNPLFWTLPVHPLVAAHSAAGGPGGQPGTDGGQPPTCRRPTHPDSHSERRRGGSTAQTRGRIGCERGSRQGHSNWASTHAAVIGASRQKPRVKHNFERPNS